MIIVLFDKQAHIPVVMKRQGNVMYCSTNKSRKAHLAPDNLLTVGTLARGRWQDKI